MDSAKHQIYLFKMTDLSASTKVTTLNFKNKSSSATQEEKDNPHKQGKMEMSNVTIG
jgi:hypothetical protein